METVGVFDVCVCVCTSYLVTRCHFQENGSLSSTPWDFKISCLSFLRRLYEFLEVNKLPCEATEVAVGYDI